MLMPPCILIAGTDWKLRANPVAPSPPTTQQAQSLAAAALPKQVLKFRNILHLQVLWNTNLTLEKSVTSGTHTSHLPEKMKASALTEYQPSYMICLFLLLFRNLLSCMLEKCLKQPLIGYIWTRTLSFMGISKNFLLRHYSICSLFPMRNPTRAAGCPKLVHTVDSIKPIMVTNENENISVPFRLPICISVNTDTRIEVISGIPSTSSGFSGTSSHS